MKFKAGEIVMLEYGKREPERMEIIDWDDITETYLVRYFKDPKMVNLFDPRHLRYPYPLELEMSEN